MNYKNSTVRKILLGATLFSILTTSLPNSVIAADTYVTNNVESISTVDKDESHWKADDFEYYDGFNDEKNQDVARILGFSEKGFKKLETNKNLVIPELSKKGNPITEIASNAFSHCDILTVDMPNSIEYIGSYAFNNSFDSFGIKKVIFSKNITGIDHNAFSNNNLISIDLPKSLTKIGSHAFANNKLSFINLPKNITEIGDSAFRYNKIERIIFPDKLTKIEKNTFSNNRISNLTLPENIKEIQEYAFSSNRIENLNLPKNLETIERNAFSWNNIESINLPTSLLNLSGFSNNKIKSLKIPENVKSIGENAFSRNMISKINIPDSVESIGKDAFSYNQISELTMSKNLKSIGDNAFMSNKIRAPLLPISIKHIGESAFDFNEIASFKNFPKNLILSDDGKNTYTTGYVGQKIKVIANNNKFNVSLQDSEKNFYINSPYVIQGTNNSYSLKNDKNISYHHPTFKVNPYWVVDIENNIKINIFFESNGGFGKMDNEYIDVVDFYNHYKLPVNKFTPPLGKKFAGWKVNVEFSDDYIPDKYDKNPIIQIFKPGQGNFGLTLSSIQYAKNVIFIAQWEDINKDTNPPIRPDDNRPNIQDVNLNNTKDYIKRLLRNEGILTPFKANQIDKAQTVDELIYLNNLYLKDKFNKNENTHTIVEKHYIEKPVYIYNNETRYIDRNTKSHIDSYMPKYVYNDFKKSDEKQIDVKDSKVQKNNITNRFFKFLIGMNLYYKNIDRKDELFEMDVAPFIENDRTMIPLRYVAEALSCDVKWDNKTRTASFTKDGVTASIQIDGNEIVLSNGEKVKMDSKPTIKNDRLCVSLTNVAKVFNLTNGNTKDKIDQNIEWDQESKTVTINLD